MSDNMRECPHEGDDTVCSWCGYDSQGVSKEAYEKRLIEFRKMITALRYGVIEEDNADFVAHREWLRDNFKKEYIDLF